ncbi:6-bladed beta-propeller [Methylolobus aquaticus]
MAAKLARHFALLLTTALATNLLSRPAPAADVEPMGFVAPNAESYSSLRLIGSEGNLNDEFSYPHGTAVDASGNIWVVDQYNQRVSKFDANGNFLFNFGGPGSGLGYFSYPRDIAVDRQGNLWVADTGNDRVQKFDPDGNFICEAPGLNNPYGIGADPVGNSVFVANTGSHAIVRLGLNCANNGSWGGPGSDDGRFSSPYDIAIDTEGLAYVADFNNDRIQVFRLVRGVWTFQRKWGLQGAGDSRFAGAQLNGPAALAFDGCGDLYVSDFYNDRMQVFRRDGSFVTSWGWTGKGSGQLDGPVGVAVDFRGRVVVADYQNHRVQIFQPSTSDISYLFQTKWGSSGAADGLFNYPTAVAVDPASGEVFVADQNNNRIQVFDRAGNFLRKWGVYGAGTGQFYRPIAVAVNTVTHEVYVADYYNHRVQVFTPDGTYQRQWGGSGKFSGQFTYPRGIAVDSARDWVYVTDSYNDRVQKFQGSTGGFLLGVGNGTSWTGDAPTPSSGSGNRWFNSPAGVAVDPKTHDIYVVEYSNRRVQKLSSNGVFRTRWGSSGSGKGQFSNPIGVTVDPAGNLYVVDQGNNRIQKFASTGQFITSWGSYSNIGTDGLFYNPEGLAFDGSTNTIFVTDGYNQRVQVFEAFGLGLSVTPALNRIVQDAVAEYTARVTAVGPNSGRERVNICLLSGKPPATTYEFSRPAVVPPRSSTLSLDTKINTPARTYDLYVQARGGGQTRVKRVRLRVTAPVEP